MVSEHVQRLDVPEGTQERAELKEPLIVQRNAGHDHMADPHRCPPLCKVREEREDVRVRLARELFVLLVVDMLDVQHDEVRDLHEPVEFPEAMYVLRLGPTKPIISISKNTGTLALSSLPASGELVNLFEINPVASSIAALSGEIKISAISNAKPGLIVAV